MSPNPDLPPKYEGLSDAHKALLASLPFDDLIFRKLFDFIDECMGSYRCDDSLKFTQSFLTAQGIDLAAHMDFFKRHRVSVDCEIVTVLEPKFPVDLNEFNRRSI